MDLREMILSSTAHVFREKGIKFTMDDVARNLSISKKTIYTIFPDKQSLVLDCVDFLFDSIKESERQILENEALSTKEKIEQILGVLPVPYQDMDFTQLYILKEKYPEVYSQVEYRLEHGWEPTIALLEQGMEEGVIRPVCIPIVKMLLEAGLAQFFQRDILKRNGISYQEGLQQVVEILLHGIETESSRPSSGKEETSKC